jgi:hypothetical protein
MVNRQPPPIDVTVRVPIEFCGTSTPTRRWAILGSLGRRLQLGDLVNRRHFEVVQTLTRRPACHPQQRIGG